jgi:hypothetical protein
MVFGRKGFAIAAVVLGHTATLAAPAAATPVRTALASSSSLSLSVSRAASGAVLPASPGPRLPSPSLLNATPGVAAVAAAPAPMSIWRKLGFGLVLTGPALVGTGVYLGTRTRDQSKGVANFCRRGCGDETTPRGVDPLSRAAGMAPWLLLGTGAAAILGGGTLLWTTRASTQVHLSVALRSGRPLALLKGSF